ncbi:MAG: (2Fe-2S)-binding protein [Steroidobacteraceae bacterium]
MSGDLLVTMTVDGRLVRKAVEPRRRLVEFLREDLQLTGTKAGCQQGDCGSCTVLLNGQLVRSCLVLAAQADGASVTTIAGQLEDPLMEALCAAFQERNAVQCGFCSAGMLAVAADLLRRDPQCSRSDVRTAISANLCRCTGYQSIVDAVCDVAGAQA